MNATEFFTLFAQIMADGNMPSPNDIKMTKKLDSQGITPGAQLDWKTLTSRQKDKLDKEIDREQISLTVAYLSLLRGKIDSGCWVFPPDDIGNYGTDYLGRTGIVQEGIGANVREDAVYAIAQWDSFLAPLEAVYNYTITLTEDVPVNAFWSITMYDKSGYLIENDANKYAVSSWQSLKREHDGSIRICIQTQPPKDQDRVPNWLPTSGIPKEDFKLTFRAYWPSEALLNKTWEMPGILKNTGS